ncbi:hypothetical protein [Paucibacter sp. XJ19-41]|uniref:hypothetical protein n=1 Tax=Paucibacter sp. XJ19-41 TaxID=2927824 RepID=UPI00234A5C9F|nr:hypothetical protein [Paucibacter sp. XJ19-41]MDC6168793.1 hypothetical protein [Paucibacter sp. XJ19-41]
MRTREIGLIIVELGGGRRQAGDVIDMRVGLSGMRQLGDELQAGEPLAWVHAGSELDAERAVASLQAACELVEPGTPWQALPLVAARVG